MAIKKNTLTKTNPTNSNGWNTIKGRMNLFVKTFNPDTKDERIAVSTSVGQRNDDGTFTNTYIPIYFKSTIDIELDDGVNVIDIKNAFFTTRTDRKTGEVKLALMVTDCTTVTE